MRFIAKFFQAPALAKEVARSIFGNQERYQGIEDLTLGLTALQKKKIDLLCIPMSIWLASDSFSKNMELLARYAQVFLQIQPPVLAFGQARSPLPPYWVLARKSAVTTPEIRSGWFFFEGKPKPQSRAE
ncbi:MAG: hypothetical protein V4507_14060, partial [Verrucomicrobiota bacterium]